MRFDAEKYKATNFKDRVKSIPVPALKNFFIVEDDDKKDTMPVWTVRGLTGIESARARQAVAESQNLEAVVEALGTGKFREKIDAIKKIAGIIDTEDVPEDLVRRYSWITQASIDPVCDYPLAIKLAGNHPEEFYQITNTIIALTGEGRLGE